MGILPWSSTRGRPHPQGGRARLSAPDADDLELANHPELSDGLQVVQVVAAAPATAMELQGLDATLAEFRAAVPLSTEQARHEGRHVMKPETLGARIGVAAAGALLLGFGGAGAFALTGSLPGGDTGPTLPDAASASAAAHVPAQVPVTDGDEAGDEAGDDDASGPKTVPTTAVGPDATGPAAFGLCNAWSHAKESKRTAEHSVAFRNLVKAAGGVDKVDGYCATVEHPSARAGDKAKDKAKDKGKGHGNGKAEGKGKGATAEPSTAPGKGPKDKPQGQQGGQGQGRGQQGPATTSPSTPG
jgi:hypothetical protein